MMTSIVHDRGPLAYAASKSSAFANELNSFDIALNYADHHELLRIIATVREKSQLYSFESLILIANHMVSLLRMARFGAYEELELYNEMQIAPSNPLDALFSPIERCIAAKGNNRPMSQGQSRKILDALDACYTQDIRITDLAKRFFISANHLSVLIKKETNCTFTELLIQKRIALAKKLLRETELPIQDIVDKVGYKEYSCFIKLFKKHTGVTPFVYHKEHQS